MKKILVIILAAVMILVIAACGNGNSTTGSSGSGTTQSTTQHQHNYACEETKSATCQDAGEMTYTCECGHTYTEEIAAIGHNYTAEQTKEATCAAQGEVTNTCHCGDSYIDYIPSPEHVFDAWVDTIQPTMTDKGQAQRVCGTCGFTETKELEVYTKEQAMNKLLDNIAGLPTFQSADELSANALFWWLSMMVKPVSFEWNDETFQITKVFNLANMDACTLYYLERTYDYNYLVENNEDLNFNEDKTQLIWITYGAGGGYTYRMESYEKIDDTCYILRYGAIDYESSDPVFYGTLTLKLVDGRFVIEAHSQER